MKHSIPFYLLLFLILGCGDGSKSTSDTEVKGEKVAIVKEPLDYDVEEGSEVKLEVEARGTPPLTYQWLKHGEDSEPKKLDTARISRRRV